MTPTRVWLAVHMEIVDLGHLTDSERADLEGEEDDPFDGAGIALRFRPKDRHVAIRGSDGRLVASAGLTEVEIEVAGKRFPVVGLGGVIVNAEHRGRGLARQIVEQALARACEMGPRFVVLFCHADRVGLYVRLGFVEIASRVLVQQPHGSQTMPMCTMWRALTPQASWPDGPVEIHGLPF
jgi:predicted N-acetyltransferase YhbS